MKPIILQQQLVLDKNHVFMIIKSHFEKLGYDVANMQDGYDDRSTVVHIVNKNIELK